MKYFEFEGSFLMVPEEDSASSAESCRCGINLRFMDCLGFSCRTCVFNVLGAKKALEDKKALTQIEKPFGLLSQEVQKALKKAWNGKGNGDGGNIQEVGRGGAWATMSPLFRKWYTYRLDPDSLLVEREEREIVKEMTLSDIISELGYEVKIIKEGDQNV